MARAGTGHTERLPSGSYRVHVYAGTDPLTGRAVQHRQTVKTQQQARIILGRLLEQAADRRRPDSRVTVAHAAVVRAGGLFRDGALTGRAEPAAA